MYIHQYEQLSIVERTDTLLCYGQYLLFREDEQATYVLFALGSFFVEIMARKPDEFIEHITCFHDTAELQPYLDRFQVSELYG